MANDNQTDSAPRYYFRFRYVLMLAALLLFIFSLLSHSSADLSILEGGVDEPLHNWIGPVGAQISRALLYLFGLATYPITFLLILSIIRSFIPYPLQRRGYIGSLIAVIIGATILMAMWPQDLVRYTDALGIGRIGAPELAFSGGVIGSRLAAPETEVMSAGLIREYIGTIGTVIVAFCLLAPGLFFLFMADWKEPLCALIRGDFSPERKTDKSKDERKKTDEDDEKSSKQILPPPPLITRPGEEAGKADPISEKQNEKAPAAPEKESAASEPEKPAGKVIRDDEEKEEEDDDYVVAPPTPLPGQAIVVTPAHKLKIMPREKEEDPEPRVEPVTPPPPPSMRQPAEEEEESPVRAASSANPEPNLTMYSDERNRAEKAASSAHSSSAPHNFNTNPDYLLPNVRLLAEPKKVETEDMSHIEKAKESIQATLDSFGIEGHVSEIVVGPRVTRFEITVARNVKVEKVTAIQNNIAMELAAESIRILAPIPGKNAVGIEVPNKVSSMVYIRSLVESQIWKDAHAEIPIILGRDVSGKVVVTDLAKAPHLLIAGSTGSGKSVCMNTLIMSLLFKFPPSDLRLIMVDPKFVELEMYRPLPHLITPVVNDPKKVPLALRWGVNEMERRYKVLAKVKSKNLAVFNSRPRDPEPVLDEDGNVIPPRLPLLIIIIDELADIMMTEAKGDVETSICRIAQKGRAAGIHLVIATQTPRKDIITGVIKANLPTKIAFKVVSGMDSRVILDCNGAEKLLGKGDMLFRPPGGSALERIQGSMVSDPEIQRVVDFVSGQEEQHFDTQVVAEAQVKSDEDNDNDSSSDPDDGPGEPPSEFANSIAAKYLQPGDGDLVRKALEIILSEQKASTSYLQRRLGIGYNKSAEIMDLLEQRHIISAPLPGGQKREILVLDELLNDD